MIFDYQGSVILLHYHKFIILQPTQSWQVFFQLSRHIPIKIFPYTQQYTNIERYLTNLSNSFLTYYLIIFAQIFYIFTPFLDISFNILRITQMCNYMSSVQEINKAYYFTRCSLTFFIA